MIKPLHTDITVRAVRDPGRPIDQTSPTKPHLIEQILDVHKIHGLIVHPLLIHRPHIHRYHHQVLLILELGNLLPDDAWVLPRQHKHQDGGDYME